MRVLPDSQYVCRTCGLVACRDLNPSPTEDQRICADCALYEEIA